MAIALLCYGIVRFATGIVSLGSLTIALVFPASLYVYLRVEHLPLADFWPLQTVAGLLGMLIIVRHRSNIARLLHSGEMRPTGCTDTEGTNHGP